MNDYSCHDDLLQALVVDLRNNNYEAKMND